MNIRWFKLYTDVASYSIYNGDVCTITVSALVDNKTLDVEVEENSPQMVIL